MGFPEYYRGDIWVVHQARGRVVRLQPLDDEVSLMWIW
jgi:hypothetical protein